MTVEPSATPPLSRPGSWAGFSLWVLVGAALVLGFLILGVLALIAAVVLAVVMARRSKSNDGRVLFGLVAGAGLPLLLVAALNWSDWHHRVTGDGTPNPYYWGGVGVLLLAAGIVPYVVRSRRK